MLWSQYLDIAQAYVGKECAGDTNGDNNSNVSVVAAFSRRAGSAPSLERHSKHSASQLAALQAAPLTHSLQQLRRRASTTSKTLPGVVGASNKLCNAIQCVSLPPPTHIHKQEPRTNNHSGHTQRNTTITHKERTERECENATHVAHRTCQRAQHAFQHARAHVARTSTRATQGMHTDNTNKSTTQHHTRARTCWA